MNKRVLGLLDEMRGIFGGSFGDSLVEADELSEAPKPMPRNSPSKKGLVSKGKDVPTRRGGKGGMSIGAKRAAKKRDSEGNDRFHAAMRDIRGEMDKSKQKSDAKKAREQDAAAGGDKVPVGKLKPNSGPVQRGRRAASGAHYPFAHARTIGHGPDNGDKRDATHCWHCSCGPIYSKGCDCTSTGKGAKCPKAGTEKHITYHEVPHRSYNKRHHKCVNKSGHPIDCKSHGG